MSNLTVDFCGELYQREGESTLTLGREADVVIDDENPFLHRQFLIIAQRQGLWWLTNVGTQLTATVSDGTGGLQAWLAPGVRCRWCSRTRWCGSPPVRPPIEFDIFLDDSSYEPVEAVPASDGTVTIGTAQLTPDQKLLIIALCENVLRRGDRGRGSRASSIGSRPRSGWCGTITSSTASSKRLREAVGPRCRGLRGGPTKLAKQSQGPAGRATRDGGPDRDGRGTWTCCLTGRCIELVEIGPVVSIARPADGSHSSHRRCGGSSHSELDPLPRTLVEKPIAVGGRGSVRRLDAMGRGPVGACARVRSCACYQG